jgi:hypothetical protein
MSTVTNRIRLTSSFSFGVLRLSIVGWLPAEKLLFFILPVTWEYRALDTPNRGASAKIRRRLQDR